MSLSDRGIKISVVLLTCGLWAAGLQAQDCVLNIEGSVYDHHTGEAMPYVSVYERSIERGVYTDDEGKFQLKDLCPGELHLRFGHLGCEEVELYVDLQKDTFLLVELHHNAELLGEVEIHGDQYDRKHLGAQEISRSDLDSRSDEDLTSMLRSINGLSSIQNGSALAKPIYQGMSGNRLSILNNGVAQSGQQWGADHAPEIDPFAADRLTVIQGVNTLTQNGPNLGGMILVEMSPIPKDPHLHGNVNYGFVTNGAGHTLNSRIEKAGKWASWRLSLTAKKIADRKSPEYFLTNTASQQLNGALLLEKDLNKHWRSSLYLSSFNTEIGVLRGSHIGNLTDLREAFVREIPFFTESSSDYNIDSPRQEVGHQFLKFKNSYETGLGNIEFTYAGQLNTRKEFDVRRGGRSDQAALHLDQSDHFFEGSFRINPDSALSFKTGIQYRFRRNTNDSETGILPLVPDYLSQNASAYLTADWDLGLWQLAAGARVDRNNIYALPISASFPRVIERKDLWYTNPSAVLTLRYDWTEEFQLEGEFGVRQRSPEVNELFSSGLHQGVSGIEEGDESLENERGILGRVSASYHLNEKYFITVSAYQNHITDFIYLVPQESLRLTIRGAFPVFQYEQVDAILRGLDMTVSAELGKRWRLRSAYSFLKGEEQGSGLALVGIPANNGSLSLFYETKDWKGFEDIDLGLNFSLTERRDDLLSNNDSYPDRDEDSPLQGQDFLPAPAAYSLLSVQIKVKRNVGGSAFSLGVRVDNLLNTKYRDYLDRQRYFADAMGRNIKIRMAWEF